MTQDEKDLLEALEQARNRLYTTTWGFEDSITETVNVAGAICAGVSDFLTTKEKTTSAMVLREAAKILVADIKTLD